jgi:hypothetical protein
MYGVAMMGERPPVQWMHTAAAVMVLTSGSAGPDELVCWTRALATLRYRPADSWLTALVDRAAQLLPSAAAGGVQQPSSSAGRASSSGRAGDAATSPRGGRQVLRLRPGVGRRGAGAGGFVEEQPQHLPGAGEVAHPLQAPPSAAPATQGMSAVQSATKRSRTTSTASSSSSSSGGVDAAYLWLHSSGLMPNRAPTRSSTGGPQGSTSSPAASGLSLGAEGPGTSTNTSTSTSTSTSAAASGRRRGSGGSGKPRPQQLCGEDVQQLLAAFQQLNWGPPR